MTRWRLGATDAQPIGSIRSRKWMEAGCHRCTADRSYPEQEIEDGRASQPGQLLGACTRGQTAGAGCLSHLSGRLQGYRVERQPHGMAGISSQHGGWLEDCVAVRHAGALVDVRGWVPQTAGTGAVSQSLIVYTHTRQHWGQAGAERPTTKLECSSPNWQRHVLLPGRTTYRGLSALRRNPRPAHSGAHTPHWPPAILPARR